MNPDMNIAARIFQIAAPAMAACAIQAAAASLEADAEFDAGQPEASVAAPSSGGDVLRRATSIFPTDPISLFGSLIVRKQSGVIVKELPFSMSIDWGATPARASCAIMDAFGRNLSQLEVTRGRSGKMSLALTDGDGNPMPAPSPSAQLYGTDISWLDLTFAYMWWDDATLLGSETYKGVLCDIVEVRPPEAIDGCSAVRLWIDRKHGFLRQAEQFDENGERVRWLWVASVGKINNRWMIRNLEVKRPGTGVQTKLHIDDLDQQ